MQIPISLLTMGALHLCLLVIAVFLLVHLWTAHQLRPVITDLLLLALQALNLILLRQVMIGQLTNVSDQLVFVIEAVFLLLLLAWLGLLVRKVRRLSRGLRLPRSIRETIDSLPGGLCFATPEGVPILTNQTMNALVYRLTGSTVLNARAVWDELFRLESAHECVRLKDPWLSQEAPHEAVFFALPDSGIWRFRREELRQGATSYLQLEATEISDWYRYSKELYENNQRLAKQYARQQDLLTHIVDINREKEILRAKMRIHDDLGQSLLTTKKHLSENTLSENSTELIELWHRTVRSLTDATQAREQAEASPEIELQKAADMIGCRIRFMGERPQDHKTLLLFYAAVREALANAVRHAGADQLNVVTTPTARGWLAEISDNGTVAVDDLTEGNGLGDLRKRLEREGAALEVRHDKSGVTLTVALPGVDSQETVREEEQ